MQKSYKYNFVHLNLKDNIIYFEINALVMSDFFETHAHLLTPLRHNRNDNIYGCLKHIKTGKIIAVEVHSSFLWPVEKIIVMGFIAF